LYLNGDFNNAPSTKKEETLLFLTRDFTKEMLVSTASSSNRLIQEHNRSQSGNLEQRTAQHFSHLAVAAAESFSYGRNVEGAKQLDLACDCVKDVLRNEPLQLMLRVWYTATQNWEANEVRIYFLCFIRRMTVAVLGSQHPLVKIFHLMADQQTLDNAIESTMEVMVAVNRAATDMSFEASKIRDVRGALDTLALRILRRSNRYNAADKIARFLIANYEFHYGAGSEELRRLKVQLAAIYSYQRRFDVAAQTLESVLQNSDFSQAEHHDYENCRAAWELGMIYGWQGAYAKSARILEFALQIFDSKNYDRIDRDTVQVLLETALNRLGDHEKVERLHNHYEIVSDPVILTRAEERMKLFEWPKVGF
jgi:hypothetical protein